MYNVNNGEHAAATAFRGAGTDANVFMEMHGAKGSTGERKLDDKQVNH